MFPGFDRFSIVEAAYVLAQFDDDDRTEHRIRAGLQFKPGLSVHAAGYAAYIGENIGEYLSKSDHQGTRDRIAAGLRQRRRYRNSVRVRLNRLGEVELRNGWYPVEVVGIDPTRDQWVRALVGVGLLDPNEEA